jgi:6-pyruvoyltetrahydropterin/6-carboxytetrahydropterin synthase
LFFLCRVGTIGRMYTVMVESEFFAEHQVVMPDGFQEPLHGHLWKVTAAVASEKLDSAGLAFDFCRLQQFLSQILGPFADTKLEECEAFGRVNASAENLARYVYDRLAMLIMPPIQLCWVEVLESPGCRVRYEP